MRTKEIERLEKKRATLILELANNEKELKRICYEYERFFLNNGYQKDKINFKLYKRFPTIATFKTYIKYSERTDRYNYNDPHHPLDVQYYENGSRSFFNPEELAVLIKLIYQFQTGKEYNILTTGNMIERDGLCNVYPKLYYIVGDEKNLEKYQEYNGNFYEDLDKFDFKNPQKDLIAIPHIGEKKGEILVSKGIGKETYLYNYDKYIKEMSCFEYKTCRNNSNYGFREDVNIFREQFKNHLDEINAHRDLFTFKIAEDDNFISNILYSIMI